MSEAEFWAAVLEQFGVLSGQLSNLAEQNAAILTAIDGLAGLVVVVLLLCVGLLAARLLSR